MPSNLPKFTLRTNQQTLDKFRYVADNNFRTINAEVTRLILKHIAEYEREHGEIQLPKEE